MPHRRRRAVRSAYFCGRVPAFVCCSPEWRSLFFSHNTTSTFLINFVEHAGGGIETLGYLTAFLTALEVPTMLFFLRIFRRRSCTAVLRFRLSSSALKTAAIAAAPNIPLLFAAESLQVLSRALYAPAIVAYVTPIVPTTTAVKGQSLAFSMTTIGGVLASLISGRLLDVLPPGNGMDRSGGLRRRWAIAAAAGKSRRISLLSGDRKQGHQKIFPNGCPRRSGRSCR